MKRKRYKKGQAVGDFLTFYKEAFPHFTNSGRKKIRMGFFRCIDHPENFYLLSFDSAKSSKRKGCLCQATFNDEELHKPVDRLDVDLYSYTSKLRKYEKMIEQAPPGWFFVTRMGAFIRGREKNILFYKFEKTNRTGADYRCARRIEDITWNRPKSNKAFYLMRMSYELDALHQEGVINFKSDTWNRGAGMQFFKEWLEKNQG